MRVRYTAHGPEFTYEADQHWTAPEPRSRPASPPAPKPGSWPVFFVRRIRRLYRVLDPRTDRVLVNWAGEPLDRGGMRRHAQAHRLAKAATAYYRDHVRGADTGFAAADIPPDEWPRADEH